MARFYRALQIQDGPLAGRWKYTVSSDDEGWTHTIGFCTDTVSCPECKTDSMKLMMPSEEDDCPTCHGKRRIPRDPPCLGHDTADEAYAHYVEFQIHERNEGFEEPEEMRKCLICFEWTTLRRVVGPPYSFPETYVLCVEHNLDVVAADLFRKRKGE